MLRIHVPSLLLVGLKKRSKTCIFFAFSNEFQGFTPCYRIFHGRCNTCQGRGAVQGRGHRRQLTKDLQGILVGSSTIVSFVILFCSSSRIIQVFVAVFFFD